MSVAKGYRGLNGLNPHGVQVYTLNCPLKVYSEGFIGLYLTSGTFIKLCLIKYFGIGVTKPMYSTSTIT